MRLSPLTVGSNTDAVAALAVERERRNVRYRPDEESRPRRARERQCDDCEVAFSATGLGRERQDDTLEARLSEITKAVRATTCRWACPWTRPIERRSRSGDAFR
jgi:hypothetical protein